jgi:hypothetical protein
MKILYSILFIIVYEYASIRAFQRIHNKRTEATLIQIKYPIITSHTPFSHKYYHIMIYGFLFYKAFNV